jgi:hypothetical protein
MALKDYGSSKNNLGYLDKTVNNTDNYGVFSFAAAGNIKRENQAESRCDSDLIGPVCITWDGRSAYSLPLGISLSDLKFLKVVLDFAPDFYIIYTEVQERELDVLKRNYDNLPEWQQQAIDNGWVNSSKLVQSEYLENKLIALHPQRHARTLGELFKLIIEWSIVNKEPFNNTEVQSVISSKILELMDMPEDVYQELLDSYPDTHVALYLQNDPSATQRPENVPNITPLFEAWIEEKLLNYQYRGPIRF